MGTTSPEDVTQILTRAARGEETATARLPPLVYENLRALAGSYLQRERTDHTLQPTALVHEAYVKLLGGEEADWNNRAHFFAVAASAMRQILTDHARQKKAAKRGGGEHRISLSGLKTPASVESQIDLIALDEALTKLAGLSPRQNRIVEMRFLAGLDENEVAQILGVTTRTVQREWRLARAFLRSELTGHTLS
jgi:RNA polymerase sigma factor (TIGR02999 family)